MSTEQLDVNTNSGESTAAPPRKTVEHGQLASGSVTGVIFAILGGLFAWTLLVALYPVFEAPAGLSVEQPTAAQTAELQAAQQNASLYNSILVLAWFGGLVAGAIAIGEGWALRSWKMALGGLLGCGLAGAVLGGLAGWVGESVYQYAKPPGQATIDFAGTIVVQMTMLAVLGGGVGLAYGSLTGQAGSTVTRLLGGVLAGLFAGMVYPVVAAYLLPAAHTEHIIPRGNAATLLWFGLTGVCLGLVLPEMKIRRTRSKVPAASKSPARPPAASELSPELQAALESPDGVPAAEQGESA